MKGNLPQILWTASPQASTLIANTAVRTTNFRLSQPKTILSQSKVKSRNRGKSKANISSNTKSHVEDTLSKTIPTYMNQ